MTKRITKGRKNSNKKRTQYMQRSSIERKMREAPTFEQYLEIKKNLYAIR